MSFDGMKVLYSEESSAAQELKWHADDKAILAIMELGFTHEYRQGVQVAEIDVDGSSRFQSRGAVGRKDGDHIALLRTYMEHGESMPAVTLYQMRNGRYRIIDGIHRVSAALLIGVARLDAHVVTSAQGVDDPMLADLAQTINLRSGLSLKVEERLEIAFLKVLRKEKTVKEAALMWMVNPNAIHVKLRAQEARKRARPGLTKADSIEWSDKTWSIMNSITSDPVLIAAVRLGVQARLTAQHLSDLSKDIRDKRSESDQMDVIGAWRKRPDIAVRIRGTVIENRGWHIGTPSKPISNVIGVLSRLQRLRTQYPTLRDMGAITDDEVMMVRAKIAEVLKEFEAYPRG